MNTTFPPISEVKGALEALGHAAMHELARLSGVPFTTLWKIRGGITANPGIETVRLFYPHINAALQATTKEKAAGGAAVTQE